MSHFIIAQLIGGSAVGFSIMVYQVNRRGTMLSLSTVAATLYAISCLYLHAYTGAALDMLSALQCYAYFRSESTKNNVLVFILFVAVAALATTVTWAGMISLLPFFGSIVSGYASSQLQTKNIRRIALISGPFWLSYAVLIHAYPAIFINIVIICSNLLGQHRFDKKQVTEVMRQVQSA
jgi:hypothetical protein